ncbi:MAG: hypothetical protein GX038_03310 [Erysipelothrix sp.]|nr:hypothetical protein [Erysipelothrix sp.]
MDRIKANKQTRRTVFLYALAIVMGISAVLIWFVNILSKSQNTKQYYYALSPYDLITCSVSEISISRIVGGNQLFSIQVSTIYQYILPLGILLLLCVLLLSIIFLRVLGKIKEEEHKAITEGLGIWMLMFRLSKIQL